MHFSWNGKFLARQAALAALYSLLTLSGFGVSYGPVQFRYAELLNWLAFFDPKNILGLSLGCAIANFWSPFGFLDVAIGSLGTFLACWAMARTKSKLLASLWPAAFSFLYSAEALFLGEIPLALFLPVTLQIMVSELVIVAGIGLPLLALLERNSAFRSLIQDKSMEPTKESWTKKPSLS